MRISTPATDRGRGARPAGAGRHPHAGVLAWTLAGAGARSPGGSLDLAPAFAGARSPGGSRGFTLLEMLVALAIFSLAALALVRLQAVSVRTAADLRERTMAQIVARNLAFEALTDPEPPAAGEGGGTVDNGGQQWRWTRTVAPLEEPRLLAITVRVEGGPGTSPAVLTVTRPAK